MYWPGSGRSGPRGGPRALPRPPGAGILRRPWTATAGMGLWLALMAPAARAPLEADMALHMLAQLPLLALAGGLMGAGVPDRARAWLNPWNQGGVSGLLLASITMAAWMLPVALDAALERPVVAAAKFLSLPLLLGLPCALSWPRAGFIVRGLFLVELIATLFRTAWLYLASPARLCASYRLDEQQIAGQGLLAAGALVLILAAGRLLWSRSCSAAASGPPSRPALTRPAARNKPAGPGRREG